MMGALSRNPLLRICAALLACVIGGYIYVRYLEPNWIMVSHVRIQDDGLAKALGKSRIVHVTDLHIDRFGIREKSMINQVNWQRPDWIVITGDLINNRQGWPVALDVIKRLKARHGVWVVPGNTDNAWLSAQEFEEGLKKIKAHVLRNGRAPMGDTGAWLIGLDDPVTKRARLQDVVREFGPGPLPPIVVLAHGPDILPDVAAAGLPVVLVGHTHGGQLGISWLRKFSEYADRGPYVSGGVYHQDNTALFVNRGIGSKMRPHRLLAPPEVAVIEFRPGKGRSHAAARTSGDDGGITWLSDFETDGEHAMRWYAKQAYATRVPEHATHGRFAAKITFAPSNTSSSFMMADYMSRDEARRDWSRYETLAFDLYNPQPTQERVALHLQSIGGRAHRETVTINGESAEHIELPLRQLADRLDLSYMTQMSFFQDRPARENTFYLDAVGLRGSSTAPVAKPVAQPLPAAPSWRLAWASSLVKLLRDPSAFQPAADFPIRMSLARGEYESAQLVILGGKKPATVSVEIGPLRHDDGKAAIPPSVIDVRRVGYVGEWPDPLPSATTVEVPAKQVQPVWITIGAPIQLPAGRYTGTITLTDDGGARQAAALEVTVWNFALPKTSTLKTAFDFYRPRMEEAYRTMVPGGSSWEGKMDELERRYHFNMLKHRISPIWGADPTTPQFARDISQYLDRGLTVFGVGSKGGSHGNDWAADPVMLEEEMVWYRQAAMELKFLKLQQQAYVYTYDEPEFGDPHVAQVMAAVHQADPSLKTLLVMYTAPDPVKFAEWLKDVDILCLRITSFDPAQVAQFKQMGKEVWMYVSSPTPPYPALMIDEPAINHRIIPWMAWKHEAAGLLYWCVNFWNEDPWTNPAGFAKDQNGNGSLYYPSVDGPVPSIRLEALRDGIEDYEYLHLLHKLSAADPLLTLSPDLVESLSSYSTDPARLSARRQAIAEAIERLLAAQASRTP